ncbi:MAG: S8 family serine peptidase, partial [Deltaproteobacteria bacterium]|nr:S8 family serine peptidase [Deltaproteobacteria bacterium]
MTARICTGAAIARAPLLLFASPLWASAAAPRPIIGAPIAAGDRLLRNTLPPNLDRKLALAYRIARAEWHPRGGVHPLLGNNVDAKGVRVTLRLVHAVTSGDVAQIETRGCEVDRLDDGAVANLGRVVAATCSWEGLWQASALPAVERITPIFGMRVHAPTLPPLNTTGRETEAYPLSESVYPEPGGGKGMVIADMDSGVDVFHPMFFRADGGRYPWIDLDGSGAFEPGTDAVDFNRNGVADPGETLRIIKAAVYWLADDSTTYNTEPGFVAGLDWLYQDENGDGQRNQGSAPPYGDHKPTFGEQLYVADDVNKNGLLDVGEKLLRLNTPKIRAVHIGKWTFRRGTNLSMTPPEEGLSHGTMVMGTLAGGVPGVTRYWGMAPEADLLLAQHGQGGSLVTDLAWAKSEGAKIVLWEMATWFWEALDGSSDLELACDDAFDEGVLQIAAAGNLAGSRKHRRKLHAAGTETVDLVIPEGATYEIGDFLWREEASLSFSATFDGHTVELAPPNGQTTLEGTSVFWQWSESPRNTRQLAFYLSSQAGLRGQTMSFEVRNTGGPVTLHGYVTDSTSSWSGGSHWPADTTDENTYGTPAVGDKTLAVGTYFVDFIGSHFAKGQLAYYSSRGPRIDGLDTLDFATPEDHITAMAGLNTPPGALMVGGGTSNASPVAVGSAAVLWGLNPTLTAQELASKLRESAVAEAAMGPIPNDSWGRGKLRVFRAHTGAGAPANEAPVAAGRVTRT